MPESSPLRHCLIETIESLTALQLALETEHEALCSNNAKQLELATRVKQDRLSAHHATQAVLEQALGVDPFRPDPESAGAPEIKIEGDHNQALLERLRDLANSCQQSNQRNGALIAQMQQRTQDTLGILRNNHTRPLYSDDGLSSSARDSRSLGKA